MLIEDLLARAKAVEKPNGCPRPSQRGPHTSIVIGVSSRARPLPVAELPTLNWDFEYGLDPAGAFELASSLGGSSGRAVLISALRFHHRQAGRTYTAVSNTASQTAGRETMARWLDGGLSLDLLWCVGGPWPTGPHEQTIRSLVSRHGGSVAQVDDDTSVVQAYLNAVWR
jgi:hypothetical protein